MTECARFFQPDVDVWSTWQRHVADGRYAFTFHQYPPNIALAYAQNLMCAVNGHNGAHPELTIRLQMVLALGEAVLIGGTYQAESTLRGIVANAEENKAVRLVDLNTRNGDPALLERATSALTHAAEIRNVQANCLYGTAYLAAHRGDREAASRSLAHCLTDRSISVDDVRRDAVWKTIFDGTELEAFLARC